MQEVRRVACEFRPHLIIVGASAYSKIIDWQAFRQIADEVNAYLMADIAHYAGLLAAGEYPNPSGYADIITSRAPR